MDPIASLLRDNWHAFEDINQHAGHQPFLDNLMVFGANDVIFLLPLLLLVFWCLCARWSPLLRRGKGKEEREGVVVWERTLGQQMVLLSVGAVALALVFTILASYICSSPTQPMPPSRVIMLLWPRRSPLSLSSTCSWLPGAGCATSSKPLALCVRLVCGSWWPQRS
jgi:hypothetical protein